MFKPSKKIHFFLLSDPDDEESSESEGADGEDLDLEGVFDDVPMDNSDLSRAEGLLQDM